MNEVTIRLHIEPQPEGGFLTTSPDVPGLIVEAETVTESVEIAQSVARTIYESCIDHGDPLPPALARSMDNVAFDVVVPVGVG